MIIENEGPEIIRTNFWQTEMAKKGGFFLSANAGAFRLLVPSSFVAEIEEFETAKDIILTRGFWPESRGDAMEILFDDGTDNPYSLHLSQSQLDRWPSSTDIGRTFEFSAWTNHGGEPFCAFRSKCLYRVAKKLPYLKSK
jgi:hypothetical protein